MNLNIKALIKSFFNRFFYQQHPEAALRYLPAVKEIKKLNLKNPKILEIGSGSLGITPYLKTQVDGLDIDFPQPGSAFLKKNKGKADQIPYRKNSYDICLSVDVLEHLDKSQREKAICEMFRVAKKLAIIIVPTGKDSEEQDKTLRNRWNNTSGQKNQFLEEHVKNGLPKNEDILVYIDRSLRRLSKKATVRSYPNLNLTVRKILMYTWITNNKYIYYLYLKGYLLLLPIFKHCNFGKTYRRVFVIEFAI